MAHALRSFFAALDDPTTFSDAFLMPPVLEWNIEAVFGNLGVVRFFESSRNIKTSAGKYGKGDLIYWGPHFGVVQFFASVRLPSGCCKYIVAVKLCVHVRDKCWRLDDIVAVSLPLIRGVVPFVAQGQLVQPLHRRVW